MPLPPKIDVDAIVRDLSDGVFRNLAQLREKFLEIHWEADLTDADRNFLSDNKIKLGDD